MTTLAGRGTTGAIVKLPAAVSSPAVWVSNAMSAALDVRGFDEASTIAAIVRPLFRVPEVSSEVLAAVTTAVEGIERIARELSQDLARRQRTVRMARRHGNLSSLKELLGHVEEYRDGVTEVRGTLLEKAAEAGPRMPTPLRELFDRLIEAQDAILGVLATMHEGIVHAMAELEKDAESDPVLASLLNAPEDDESFTDEDDRVLDEALASGFVRHQDRGNVQ
jgi:hypothetical protein